MAGRPVVRPLAWVCRAAQSHQARAGEAQEASWGTAKEGTLTMLRHSHSCAQRGRATQVFAEATSAASSWAHRVTASITWGYSLHHMGLQPPSHRVTAIATGWTREAQRGLSEADVMRHGMRRGIHYVWDALWNAVGDALWNALWDALWNAPWGCTWGLGDALRNALWNAVGDALWNTLWNALWDTVGDVLWNAL